MFHTELLLLPAWFCIWVKGMTNLHENTSKKRALFFVFCFFYFRSVRLKDNLLRNNNHNWYSRHKEGGEVGVGGVYWRTVSVMALTLRYINWEGRQTSLTGSHYALMLRHTPASLLATRASHQHSKLKPHLTGTMDGQQKDRRQSHLWILTLLILV